MNRYIIPQIKLGGDRYRDVVDYVIVDDAWMANRDKFSDTTKFAGQGNGAYLKPIFPYSDALRDKFAQACEVDFSSVKDKEVARSKSYIDEVELVKASGLTKEALIDGNPKDIIGATSWDLEKLVKNIVVDGPIDTRAVPDVKAITTGTYLVNAAGTKDYLTNAAAWADINALTGDLTIQVDSATTETATITAVKATSGHTLLFTSNSDPLGDPTAGYKTTINHAGSGIYDRMYTPAGTVIHEKLNLVRASGNTSMFLMTGSGDAITKRTRRCLIDMAASARNGIETTNATLTLLVYLNKVWGGGNAGWVGIYLPACSTSTVVESNSVYYTDYGIHGAAALRTCRNNAVIRAGVKNCFHQISSLNGYNNCDSDATGEDADWSTGSGNVSSLTTSIWQSVTDTDSTFLAPAAGSGIDGAATTPTLWTTDIAGNPYNGTIGAQQIVAAGGYVPILSSGRFGINAGRIGVREV